MKRTGQNETYTDEAGPVVEVSPATTRFQLEAELARGGLGRVLRGTDTHLGREVAIKTLLRTSESARQRFDREIRLTARLQHPNIVPVYEGGVDPEGLPFFAMRLVHGRTLTEEIGSRRELEARLGLLPNVVAACNAVAYAHHARVTHRDLKPDNVLIGRYGETVVIDWGLAKDLDEVDVLAVDDEPTDELGGSSLTRVGSVVGTPAYMPPEQAGGQVVDVRADVYALGAVLYQLLTGVAPYQGAENVLVAVLQGPPASLVTLAPGAPRDLVAVVEKAMSRDPRDRYLDAGALTIELERFLAGQLVAAHHYTPLERITRTVAANLLASGLAVAMVLLVACSVAVLGYTTRLAVRQRQEAVDARAIAESLARLERSQRDAATLDRARLLAPVDPYEALLALDGLSREHVFDGAVRSVAATALDSAPRQQWAPAGPVAWVGDQLVAGRGNTLVAQSPGKPAEALVELAGPIVAVAVNGGRRAACSRGQVAWESAPGVPFQKLDLECKQVVARGTGFFVAGLESTAQLGAGPPESHPVALTSLEAVAVDPHTGSVFLLDGVSRRLHVVPPAGPERTIRLARSAYGLVVAPDGAQAAILGRFPISMVSLKAGSASTSELDLGTDWLERGVFADGRLLVGGADAAVLRVDPEHRTTTRIPLVGRPRAMVAIPGGGVLVGTDEGHLVRVDGAELFLVGVMPDPILGLAVRDDGLQAVAWTSRAASVWAIDPRAAVLSRQAGRVGAIVPQPDGSVALVGEFGLVEVSRGSERQLSEVPAYRVTRCGDSWWTGGWDGGVAQIGGSLSPTDGRVLDLLCTRDGSWLAALSVRELLTLRPSGVVSRTSSPGRSRMVMTPDGRVVVLGPRSEVFSAGGDVSPLPPMANVEDVAMVGSDAVWVTEVGQVWRNWERAEPLAQLLDAPSGLAFDGERIAVGQAGGGIWFAEPGHAARVLAGHRQYVADLAFRPGGRTLATSGWDNDVWLWDLDTHPPTGRRLRGHDSAVVALAWSADGSQLYSGDLSGTVRVWRDPLPMEAGPLRARVAALAEAIRAGASLDALTDPSLP